VTQLRKAMLEELQRRNLSPMTTRIYLHAVEEFAQHFDTPPDRLGLDQVRQYQAHLFTDRKLEAVSVAQQLSALRFFFLKTLKRPWMVEDMPAPKQPIRLPDILSREEVERLIQAVQRGAPPARGKRLGRACSPHTQGIVGGGVIIRMSIASLPPVDCHRITRAGNARGTPVSFSPNAFSVKCSVASFSRL
jgi:integrase